MGWAQSYGRIFGLSTDDLLLVQDVSDTSESPEGTTKYVIAGDLGITGSSSEPPPAESILGGLFILEYNGSAYPARSTIPSTVPVLFVNRINEVEPPVGEFVPGLDILLKRQL